MNCPYCHAVDQRERPATQRVTFWKDSFGTQRKGIRDVCSAHASYLRLTYHVTETHDLMRNDVSYDAYQAALALIVKEPSAWPSYTASTRQDILLIVLCILDGDARYAEDITAVHTIARYDGLKL